MNIVFEKDETVKAIDIATLRETVSLAEYSGKLPSSRPMEHFDIIERIQALADKRNYKIKPDPIWVSKRECRKIPKLDPANIGSPESFHFNRVATRLNLLNLADDKHNAAIAIGYTEKGIQVAFGTNVAVCSNMCIFGKRIMVTYGNNKMPFDKLMDLVEKYVLELPEIYEDDIRILNQMYDTPVSDYQLVETIGDMQLRAVKGTYFQEPFALNIGQMSHFTQGLLKIKPNILDPDPETRTTSLYDIYNMGTEILHPERSEISTVWPDVASWSEYITESFGIN